MKTLQRFFSQVNNKQVLSKLFTLVQHLMRHEFLQYLLGKKQLGGACFMYVPANVPYVFISQSIQVLTS